MNIIIMYSDAQQNMIFWLLDQGYDYEEILKTMETCSDNEELLKLLELKKSSTKSIMDTQEKISESQEKIPDMIGEKEILEEKFSGYQEKISDMIGKKENLETEIKSLKYLLDSQEKHAKYEMVDEEIKVPKKSEIGIIPFKQGKKPLTYFKANEIFKVFSPSVSQKQQMIPYKQGKAKLKYFDFDSLIKPLPVPVKDPIEVPIKVQTEVPIKVPIQVPIKDPLQVPIKPPSEIPHALKNPGPKSVLKHFPDPLIITSKAEISNFLQSLGIPKLQAEEASEICPNLADAMLNFGLEVPKKLVPLYQVPEKAPAIKKHVKFNEPEESDPIAPESTSSYHKALGAYTVNITENPSYFTDYIYQQESNLAPNGTKRINKELTALKKTLPCDSPAAIFCLVYGSNMSKIRCLLSGTVDTPYAHGLYCFDIFLPSDYPQVPPQFFFRTTGNYSFRFNPNLYVNGKLCLSVINTWAGHEEERWDPSNSSLLQVFLSIQSLVMDSNIIQKEPGFDKLNTNSVENLEYQYEVLYGNIKYAMIDQIKYPARGFENIITMHFKEKKQEILENLMKNIERSKGYAPMGDVYTQNPGVFTKFLKGNVYDILIEQYFELHELLNSPKFN